MGANYDMEPGEYVYSEGSNNKSAYGVVKIGVQGERNSSAQRNAGGIDRQEGDHGGHLIAYSMCGDNDPRNLDAQAANVNQRDQAAVERNIRSLASDPNNTVALSVCNYRSAGERPSATMINVGVRNNTTGTIEEQHISFQNASHALQEAWSEESIRAVPEIDPLQEIGLTEEQREIANELCGAENYVDTSLGSGCTYREFDINSSDEDMEYNGNQEENEMAEVEETEEIEGGLEMDMDGGITMDE